MGGDDAGSQPGDAREAGSRDDRDDARDAQHDAPIASARALTAPARAAMLAIVPLAVIALGFITPPVIPHWLWSYGAHLHFISPFEDGASPLWSIQIVALVLAAITLIDARRRSVPGLGARIIATLGTLAVLHLAVVMVVVAASEAPVLALVSAFVIVAAVTGLVQAWHARGWRGWLWMLAAYAIAALPYACPRWPGIFNEFSGGLTFIAGDVTVLVLALRGLRDQQRR